MKNHKGHSPVSGATPAPRARLRALAVASLLAFSGHSAAVETWWNVHSEVADVALWYTPGNWSNGLPTALTTAVLTHSPDKIADMDGVDWTVGGIVVQIDGPVSLCGLTVEGKCASLDDPPGATLTIAPSAAGGTAFTTRTPVQGLGSYTDAFLLSLSGTFRHMGLVSAGRFEVAPGGSLSTERPNHFRMTMRDVQWLHSGVIEVNVGGGSGMLELRNSTLAGLVPTMLPFYQADTPRPEHPLKTASMQARAR